MKRRALLLAFTIIATACTAAIADPPSAGPPVDPVAGDSPAGDSPAGDSPAGDSPAGDGPVADTRAGDPAPAVTLQFFDGSTGTLSDFRGTPVVLNFWASWCPACVAEMPDFEAVHRRFAGDVTFLGIDLQDVDRQTAQRFIEETGVTYAMADDPTGAIYAAFGGFAMPTTVFIDADGAIVGRRDGAIFEDQLITMLEQLFGVAS